MISIPLWVAGNPVAMSQFFTPLSTEVNCLRISCDFIQVFAHDIQFDSVSTLDHLLNPMTAQPVNDVVQAIFDAVLHVCTGLDLIHAAAKSPDLISNHAFPFIRQP